MRRSIQSISTFYFSLLDVSLISMNMYAASVRSYLSVRDNAKLGELDLAFGVQQGYYLGPLLFSIYASELFTIVSNHLPATVHC